MPKALITGITGQDGSYLAEFLLGKGYIVHGIIRRSSSFNTGRINHLYADPHLKDARLFLHYGDMADMSSLLHVLDAVRPDEVYNLAAQSFVKASFEIPEYTADITGLGTLRLLQAIKQLGIKPRFYQASSSEMYGNCEYVPQSELTPFKPVSPYGCAKLFAHNITIAYRESYRLHACCGILFNHTSPRRGETFVSRKITRAVANIKAGKQDKLYLGNLNSQRDWGYAKEYVEAMWVMLNYDGKPSEYVIATNESHTVNEFVELAFEKCDLDWHKYVEIDKRYYRPTEIDILLGDSHKAVKTLGWYPKTKFKELVELMVEADTIY